MELVEISFLYWHLFCKLLIKSQAPLKNQRNGECMKRYRFVLLLVTMLPVVVLARQGWYVDFTSGHNMDVSLNNIKNNFPHGISASSEAELFNTIDFGYSFKRSFTLGTGFEFNNLVDIAYKLFFKWSFNEDKDFQPFVYSCIHGGISDVILTSIHAGFGADYFFSKKVFMSMDTRMGPCLVSGDPYEDPVTGKKKYDYHLEGTMSLGIGFLFGRDSDRH